ncbi:hypothetical protein ACHAQH_005728 [Verticillium albo-atrum]
MGNGHYVEGSYYFFAPNRGAAIFFTVAFAATGVFHFWQCYHYKFFKVTGLFVFCNLLFVAGFALRIYGAWHYDDLAPFITSICLVYASPPLLELANYHILGRILYYVPYLSPLHPGRVLSTFAFLSGLIEMLNGWGASYTANLDLPGSSQATGHALMKTSLVLQLIVAGLFVTLAVVFHRRCIGAGLGGTRQVKSPLRTLYISVALITARTVFRLVEHFGFEGIRWEGLDPADVPAVIRYEWFFYVFEAVLMLANTVMWNWRHPRRYLPAKCSIYLARDGVTEVEGPGWKDDRPWLLTVIDPFDLGGCFRERRAQDKFWTRDVVEGDIERRSLRSVSKGGIRGAMGRTGSMLTENRRMPRFQDCLPKG